MAKVSAEAQRLFDAFRDRFSSPAEAADLLRRAKDTLGYYKQAQAHEFMDTANGVLDGNGVEKLRSRNGRAVAYYVNMGGTYDTTLIHQVAPTERFLVGSWGDWLEAQERRGNRFDGGFGGGGFIG